MTLASDRISGTATKNSAVLLTEYMPDTPCLVINTGTDTVYLGTSSGVSASNGVPVEPSASVTWATAGELWAILDPAAASSSAALIITDRINGWEQSPVTIGVQVAEQIQASNLAAQIGAAVPQANSIGAAVGGSVPSASSIGTQTAAQIQASTLAVDTAVATAQKLLATGVPNVLVTAALLSQGTIAALAAIDLTPYASINLHIHSPLVAVPNDVITLQFEDANGVVYSSTTLQWNDPGGTLGTNQVVCISLPVTAKSLVVTSAAGYGYKITAQGSNRTVTGPVLETTTNINFNASQAWAGDTVLAINGTADKCFVTRGGWHYLTAFITGASKGRIQLNQSRQPDGALKKVSLTDTGEWHTGSDSVATLRIEKTVYLPAGLMYLSWQADVAATYQVDVNLWSL